MKLFEVREHPDGTADVMNVPVFKAHMDRNYVCDETWLDRCVADFHSQKLTSIRDAGGDQKYAMLPSVTIGHTPENPDAPEPPRVGFVDNIRRVGKLLYADLTNVSREVWQRMKAGEFPYRSAEIIPKKHRFTNLSLLGGRYPHFPLPVMRFRQNGVEVARYVLGGTPEMEQQELEQLAQAIAPMVAEIMAAKGSEAAAEDVKGAPIEGEHPVAGGGDEDPRESFSIRGVRRPTRPTVSRHTEHASKKVDYNKAPADTSLGGDSDSVSYDGEEMGTNTPNKHAELSSTVDRLLAENAALKESVGELRRHNLQQAQAAKRTMLVSKCREIAARGYAIGDAEAIQRHVDRMVVMKADEIRGYIADVLEKAPRVETVRRHGIHDFVERPGREVDENERYVAENGDTLRNLGLDKTVLDLADVLA